MRYLPIVAAAMIAVATPTSASTLLSFGSVNSAGGANWSVSNEISRDTRLRTRSRGVYRSVDWYRKRQGIRTSGLWTDNFPTIRPVDLSGLNFSFSRNRGRQSQSGGLPTGLTGLNVQLFTPTSQGQGDTGSSSGGSSRVTELTAVPVPATLPLLAGAIALLGYMRRRA